MAEQAVPPDVGGFIDDAIQIAPPDPPLTSLEARMQARREEIDAASTQKFQVPNYGDFLLVEMRILSWETIRKIQRRVERETRNAPELLELYAAAEQIMAATVGFWVIHPDGREEFSEGSTWVTLARTANRSLSDALTLRQAVITLCGDLQVIFLITEWLEWLRNDRGQSEREVERDLGLTH